MLYKPHHKPIPAALRLSLILAPALAMLALIAHAAESPEAQQPSTPDAPQVRIAQVTYDGGKLAACFSSGFLDLAARQGNLAVDRTLGVVPLASPDILNHPLLIIAGDGDFTLSEPERENLQRYLAHGGLLLASASCSNRIWAHRFTSHLQSLFPESPLVDLPRDHPIFRMLFEIEDLRSVKPSSDLAIKAMSLGGRLAVIFSPLGLNDTDAAGAGCCCCGGNEMRDADLINANIVAYALTH